MKPTVRTQFIGYQVWRRGRFALYNLLEPMGDHPIGSTVSFNTIQLHGYQPSDFRGSKRG